MIARDTFNYRRRAATMTIDSATRFSRHFAIPARLSGTGLRADREKGAGIAKPDRPCSLVRNSRLGDEAEFVSTMREIFTSFPSGFLESNWLVTSTSECFLEQLHYSANLSKSEKDVPRGRALAKSLKALINESMRSQRNQRGRFNKIFRRDRMNFEI